MTVKQSLAWQALEVHLQKDFLALFLETIIQ